MSSGERTVDRYDLILRGGEVVDPSQGLRGRRDVGVRYGRIAALERDLSNAQADIVLDVTGAIVTPGLVDLHAHVYTGVCPLVVPADEVCSTSGVTTIVDAGSAGCHSFPGFRQFIVNQQRTRVYGYVHISSLGLVGHPVGEMLNLAHANVEQAARMAVEHRDVCLGIKVRQSDNIVGANGLEPLRLALRAAELAGCPVMVHIGAAPAPLREIIDLLRPGDVITHCFTGRGNGVLGEDGRLLPECWEARRRGIVFDVGHGYLSHSFDVARAAIEAGFLPDTISTDLHSLSVNGPVFDMPTTMSKFLNLGLTLEEVIERSTINPARVINREEKLGTLQVGAPADVAVLRLEEGAFEFQDSERQRLAGTKRLVAVHTVRGGRLWGRPFRHPNW